MNSFSHLTPGIKGLNDLVKRFVMGVDKLSFCSDGVIEEIHVGQTDTIFEFRLIGPA